MYNKKRITRVMGVILSLLLICSLHGRAEGLTIKPTNGGGTITVGTDYTYADGLLTVKTSTPVTISSNGIETDHAVVVADQTTASITLDNVNIRSQRCPFEIQGSAKVSLVLVGVNVLTTVDNDYPALRCESKDDATASLDIGGTGELRATSSYYGAGIGGGNYRAGGDITISGGIVTATSDYFGAGIGGGSYGAGGVITISGGIVTTTSGNYGAGIGGGNNGAGGVITIKGGIVTATPGGYGAGIGGGSYGAGGIITISGGIVTATSDYSGATIGGGNNGADGTFTTTGKDGNPGNAFIIAGSIRDKTNQGLWSGVIFENNDGKVYSTPTLPEGVLTIPSGKTLTVESGKTLTIGSGTTLINEGTITNNGTISNDGVLAVKAILTNNNSYSGGGDLYKLSGATVTGASPSDGILVTFDGNGSSDAVSNLPSVQVIVKSSGHLTEPTVTPLRANYTCIGWSESSSGGSLIDDFNGITSLDNDKTIYARWKYNTKLAFTGDSYSNIYGEAAPSIAAIGVRGSSLGDATCLYYSDAGCTSKISTPTNAGTYYVKATYAGDANNMKADLITTYTIEKRELTVNTSTITKVYDGETTAGLPTFTLNNVVGGEESDVSLETGSYSLAYASKDVGAAISLTPTGDLSLSGDKSTNYKLTQPSDLKGGITERELTITPVPNQFIYSDEHPLYTISDAVGSEIPAFSGNLEISEDKVNNSGLTLADDETSGFKAANYTWKLSSSDVAITQDSKTLARAYEDEATTISDAVGTSWHKNNIVLTTSIGFKIKGSSTLKSTPSWEDNLTVDGADGEHEVKYQLKRAGRVGDWDDKTDPSDNKTLTVKMDKTAPTVTVTPDKLTVTVALSDATSGLASCTYAWNNGGNVIEALTAGNKTHSFTLTAPAAGSYSLKVVLTDRAGNETTYNETVTLTNPTTPVDPPVGPSEPEVTYTVTLPVLEGAVTDPVAGNYEVTGWGSFSFSLTLNADYNQSKPEVKANGKVITPHESDGKYIISRIRADQTVEVTGIVKNSDPVANEDLSSPALRIYTVEGILCLDVPTATEAWLITADGRLLRSLTLSPGLNRVYGLRQGIYIVRLRDGTTRKVLVG